MHLPNVTYDVCPFIPSHREIGGCPTWAFIDVMNELIADDYSPCTKMFYNGMSLDDSLIKGFPNIVHGDDSYEYVNITDPEWKGEATVLFSYKFDMPEVISVKEQYIIMELDDLIGIVGGTLGLFIGFSFLDNSLTMMNYFIIFLKKLKTFYVSKKVNEIKKPTKVAPKK